ncbi:MAG: fructose-6-phosphate aldolase [Bacteroidota bacterium]
MYIVKVKGKAKIPDYIQLRDSNFVLVAYFRADRPLKNPENYGLGGHETELAEIIDRLQFGKIEELPF